MLYSTPGLTLDDLRVIEDIEAFRSEFRHRLAEPRRWEGQLRRSLTAAAVRGSTHIEGYTRCALIGGADELDDGRGTRWVEFCPPQTPHPGRHIRG
jgi:hypothetical protein